MQPSIAAAERKETPEPGTLRLLVESHEWIELIHLLSDHLSEGGMSDEQLDHLHDILEYLPNQNTHPRSLVIYLEEPSGILVVEATAYGCKSAAQRFTPTPELLKHLHTL